MKEKKQLFNIATYGQMVLDIIIFALGIYCASNPSSSTSTIGVCFGLFLIIVGIYNVIRFILDMHKSNLTAVEITYGILNIIFGIFIITNPLSLASILTIGLGIWLIASALFKGALVIQLKKFQEETWVFSLAISIINFLIGVIVILKPFSTVLVITTFVGIMMCVYSAIDFLQQLLFRKRVKEIIKIFFE